MRDKSPCPYLDKASGKCMAFTRAASLLRNRRLSPTAADDIEQIVRNGPTFMSRVDTCLADGDVYRQDQCSGRRLEQY